MVSGPRWVALDVGETLIDETRLWSLWADALRVPRLTLFAALGAAVARGGDHRDAFDYVERPNWRDLERSVQGAYAGFQARDLYADALPAVDSLCKAGYRVALIANQPARRTPELRALGFEPDVMAMSEEMAVAKPDPAFFAKTLELLRAEDPGRVAYVGDRIDNDVIPSLAAGMRAVWLRRGPWGVIGELPAELRDRVRVVDTLTELVANIDTLWS